MQAQQAAGAAGGDAGDAGHSHADSKPQQDDVVDADFKEVKDK